MKKKFLAATLCAAMALTFVACGKEANVSTEGTEAGAVETVFIPLPSTEEAKVVLCDYENLTINLVDDYEVSADSINYLIDNVMASYGLSNQLVDDHDIIADGDLVMVDYTGYLNGEAFDGGAATDQLLDVTNNCAAGGTSGFIPGFTTGLLGQKVGETIKYEVTFPEDYGVESLNGQVTEFEFVIKGIYKTIGHEDLTDAMVAENFQETFGVSTAEDLYAYIKAYLVSSSTFDYVQNYVVENSTCEVPTDYLEYVSNMYIEYLAVRNFGSMEALQEYYTQSGYSMDDLKAGINESIESEIKSELIFMALAEKMGIEVTEEEQKEMLSAYLVENGGSYETEEDVLLEMGLGNLEFGQEYMKISCSTSNVITKIIENGTVIDADGNVLSEE